MQRMGIKTINKVTARNRSKDETECQNRNSCLKMDIWICRSGLKPTFHFETRISILLSNCLPLYKKRKK